VGRAGGEAEIGPLINAKALEKVERHVANAIAGGARVLLGGKRHALGRYFFQPTILADVDTSMDVACEETFGPVAPLFRFHSEDEVIAAANGTPFGLAAYFYARDLARVMRVSAQLQAGIVGVNEGADLDRARSLRRCQGVRLWPGRVDVWNRRVPADEVSLPGWTRTSVK
jgi:succinate-semialdehyde dehydrogenase / glutarate-semialdehyde dehydrogenase